MRGTTKEETVEITLALAALKVVAYGLAAIGPGIGIGIVVGKYIASKRK